MRLIKTLNTFAIALPFLILITYPIFKDGAVVFALFSTMITGFVQVLLAFALLIKEPKNKFIVGYFVAVILFFLLWYLEANVFYSGYLTYGLFSIPLILAIYLSYIIYKK